MASILEKYKALKKKYKELLAKVNAKQEKSEPTTAKKTTVKKATVKRATIKRSSERKSSL